MKQTKCLNSRKLFVSKEFFFAGLAILLLVSCNGEAEESTSNSVVSDVVISDNHIGIDKTQTPLESSEISGQYSFQTTFDTEKGWGYQLLDSGKVFINQPHIPAVSGNEGFSSEEKAITCAEFALTKVHLGMIPPTLTKDELDSLGVLN
jgi:hypothetical protein